MAYGIITYICGVVLLVISVNVQKGVTEQTRLQEAGYGSQDRNETDQITLLDYQNNVTLPCHVHPVKDGMYDKIKELLEEGTKLVQFNLLFPEYEVNPMRVNVSWNYKADVWHRAYTSHGKTLLSLAFNYDILSLLTLTFGVEELDVGLTDHPAGCLRTLSEQDKVRVVLDIITLDFRSFTHTGVGSQLGDDPHTCHEVIDIEGGYGVFNVECCRWVKLDQSTGKTGILQCSENQPGKWLRLLQLLMPIVKFMAVFFGPLFFEKFFKSESIRKTDYVVKLKEAVKISQVEVENCSRLDDSNKEDLKLFKKQTEADPNKEIHHLKFEEVHLYVDHRLLMTETHVPVGLGLFIFENVFMCQIREWYPFTSCCSASIFGSWTPNFLCCKLADTSECEAQKADGEGKSRSCGCIRTMAKCSARSAEWLTWGTLASLLGGLLLVATVPFPYYIRLLIYYGFEETEVLYRHDVLDNVDVKYGYQHNLLHYFTPTHWVWVLLYCLYVISFVIIGVLNVFRPADMNNIVTEAIQDWNAISHTECITLLTTHLMLPLEKFGIFGLLVGLVYWPVALTLCFVVIICYSVPTIYLIGRLLTHKRPHFIRSKDRSCPSAYGQKTRSVSNGRFSFETCLLLNTISPPDEEDLIRRPHKTILQVLMDMFIGSVCIIFMLTVFIMFSEVLGLLVEICVFTLMGAIINAANATKYVMLAFWILMYSTACFNTMYERYLKLNKEIFDFIKDRMKNDIKGVTVLREDVQKNTAFKYYFTDEEKQAHLEAEEGWCIEIGNKRRQDKLIYDQNELHWNLNSLVLFVDRKDVPRIPKKLFKEICDIEAPGCPGPIYLGLLDAFKQLMFMVLFLVFVLIVVMSFGDVYKVSSSNQTLMTLAGGFVPFILRFVLQPKKGDIRLSTYSFEGKVHHIIRDYMQMWPIWDMNFKVIQDPEEEEEQNEDNDKGENPSEKDRSDIPKQESRGTQTEDVPETDLENNKVDTEEPHEDTVKDTVNLMVDMDTGRFIIGKMDFNYVEMQYLTQSETTTKQPRSYEPMTTSSNV